MKTVWKQTKICSVQDKSQDKSPALTKQQNCCYAICSVENSSSEKFLGVIIDRKLNFNEHVRNLCNKASNKVQALARTILHMPVTQRKLLLNAYFLSQFGYCCLVWMNHSRILNNCINGSHERALRLLYSDFD